MATAIASGMFEILDAVIISDPTAKAIWPVSSNMTVTVVVCGPSTSAG